MVMPSSPSLMHPSCDQATVPQSADAHKAQPYSFAPFATNFRRDLLAKPSASFDATRANANPSPSNLDSLGGPSRRPASRFYGHLQQVGS